MAPSVKRWVNYMLKKCFLLRQKQSGKDDTYIILAYQNRINNLTWMSAETKVKAVEKLNKISIKIGYPDKWKDYSKLDIKVLLREEAISKT
jgi:predicted metalloendopeptidase